MTLARTGSQMEIWLKALQTYAISLARLLLARAFDGRLVIYACMTSAKGSSPTAQSD